MHDTVLQSIGRTPLVRLRRVTAGLAPTVAAKLESLNPGGSTKDRVAVAMIADAEKRGWLRPGATIIEATAGNTGVGLAMAAAVKGYRCVFVLPDKMSTEKIALLKAYGAEVVITPTAVAPDSPDSYNGVADRLAREIPGRGGRTSSRTSRTPRPTTARPAPKSGTRPTARSHTSSAAWGPAGASPASASTSRR